MDNKWEQRGVGIISMLEDNNNKVLSVLIRDLEKLSPHLSEELRNIIKSVISYSESILKKTGIEPKLIHHLQKKIQQASQIIPKNQHEIESLSLISDLSVSISSRYESIQSIKKAINGQEDNVFLNI